MKRLMITADGGRLRWFAPAALEDGVRDPADRRHEISALFVMAGLVPAIHVVVQLHITRLSGQCRRFEKDARNL
jgi:hypothetical protein